MVQPGQNPRDAVYDPFSYMMFGSQVPPTPPHGYYQGNSWQPGNMQPQTPTHPALLKPFLDQQGHVDVGKMVNGATQLVSVINQTAPVFKQLSPLLKFFNR
ncbi:MAG: YppG family protein [Sporolactobacillus sp.]